MSTAPEKGVDDARTLDRRSFFRAGGTAAVAAAVAIVPVADEAQAAETGTERTKARYRETEHVKNYYRVNRY
ncbi:MAG: twin-arginine translocation signal protein [Hyphomicrobiales bacterium]|nr:twin-arginine translocation signal protein [Hyphomicrobiales bacterium]